MGKYTEKQLEQRKQAVNKFDKNVDKIVCRLPLGTKERIEKTGKSGNAFIKECVLEKLDEIEKNN